MLAYNTAMMILSWKSVFYASSSFPYSTHQCRWVSYILHACTITKTCEMVLDIILENPIYCLKFSIFKSIWCIEHWLFLLWYILVLEVMARYTYKEKCAGAFPDAWTRYVNCQRALAPPNFNYYRYNGWENRIVRADLFQESQQQSQYRKLRWSWWFSTNCKRYNLGIRGNGTYRPKTSITENNQNWIGFASDL